MRRLAHGKPSIGAPGPFPALLSRSHSPLCGRLGCPDTDDEDSQLAQIPARAPPRQPARAPQGPGLRHQQDPEALQGPPGLTRRGLSVRPHPPRIDGACRRPQVSGMRLFVLTLGLVLGTAAFAQTPPARPEPKPVEAPAKPPQRPRATLDELFKRL